MISRPKQIDAIPGWIFERWEYEGAPLVARRVPNSPHDFSYTVEIDNDGDLLFDQIPDEGFNPIIIAEVMRRLVNDAIERKAPGWV